MGFSFVCALHAYGLSTFFSACEICVSWMHFKKVKKQLRMSDLSSSLLSQQRHILISIFFLKNTADTDRKSSNSNRSANASGNKNKQREITKHESKKRKNGIKVCMCVEWGGGKAGGGEGWVADERGIMHELCQIQWIECAGWMSGKHWGLLLMIVR